MLKSSLSKILSTISLSALSVGLLGGPLSSPCKAMDMDPLEVKARILGAKSLDEINSKAVKLFVKADTENERKPYILERTKILSTLADAIQLPEDNDGLRRTMLLSAAQDYYTQKSLEEEIFGKSLTFKLEKASLHEIEVEIKRLTTTIQTLTELERECVSPQIGALKAYRALKLDKAPQHLLQEAQEGYYAATAALKALSKNKKDEKEPEKSAAPVRVAPKAPQPISLSKFVNDGLDSADDEDYVDGKHTWRIVLGAGAIHNIPGVLDQWQFEPELDPTQPMKAKLITTGDSSFDALLKADPSVVGSYGVRFRLSNLMTKEKKANQFFLVLKKGN